ncbi:predicted protein, partial [Nematostella vectensis]
LTGGLAAPLIAAGAGTLLGGGAAAVLAGVQGLAIITSLFGAAGAGLTGYKMKRRLGEIEQFEFEKLTDGDHLHLTIAISGWLEEPDQDDEEEMPETDEEKGFKEPWRTMRLSRERYCELLGALCKVKGPGVYLACQEEIIRSVADNLERKLPADEVGSNEHLVQKLVPSQEEVCQNSLNLILCVITQEHKAADAAQIFHDTAGWKHLETSMRCLQSVIEGCGEEFNEHITQDLLDLIFQALNHTNRFVRETGYQLCGSLVSLGRIQEFFLQVEFYVSQTKADNHAVREAACACIAELGLKVSADYTRPHVQSLLDALIICFMDDSWPVRDAACVACGNFIQSFPNECQPKMPDLYPLFFTNLEDKIPSVRQGAAIALGNVVKAYGNEAKTIVFSKVREGLKEVQNQEAITEQFAGLDKGPATFGVVKKLRDNDMDLHTNKQMYSCGSLAPKMGRGGGCLDHLFKRPAEPWEKTDGCINLVAELSRQPPYQRAVMEVLPLVAKAGEYHHYAQHPYLLETICKQVPVIARGLGKKLFKNYLELFLETLFYSLKSENKLTSGEARECFMALGQLLGPSILRGRVEIYDHRFAGLDKGPATFGVVKKLRDNDMELHTNKQMYSCGSLAPKMGRGGGCLDHLFKRPAEPWEKTDGYANLPS